MTDHRQLQSELLSAYLDDSLSQDERAHVEQMLASDASVRHELEDLRALGQKLRASLDSDVHLDRKFQDRVWSAVIAQADVENLPDTHPVRLAQRQPDHSFARGHRQPWIAALAALAASVILITAWNLGTDNEPMKRTTPAKNLVATVPDPSAKSSDLEQRHVVPQETKPDMATAVAIADDDRSSVQAEDSGVASDSTDLIAPPAEREQLATTEPKESASDAISTAVEPKLTVPPAMRKLGFVVMLEVELTERGRDLNELAFALETAGISNINPRAMKPSQVEGFVRSKAIGSVDFESPESTSGDIQLMLVQGPAKRLDRFMLSLLGRPSVVSKVGFRMVMDPEFVATIHELAPVNPRSIRHADTPALAHHLTFGAGGVSFPRSLQSFATLTADGAEAIRWTAAPPKDEGPDFNAQLLVLVRGPE